MKMNEAVSRQALWQGFLMLSALLLAQSRASSASGDAAQADRLWNLWPSQVGVPAVYVQNVRTLARQTRLAFEAMGGRKIGRLVLAADPCNPQDRANPNVINCHFSYALTGGSPTVLYANFSVAGWILQDPLQRTVLRRLATGLTHPKLALQLADTDHLRQMATHAFSYLAAAPAVALVDTDCRDSTRDLASCDFTFRGSQSSGGVLRVEYELDSESPESPETAVNISELDFMPSHQELP